MMVFRMICLGFAFTRYPYSTLASSFGIYGRFKGFAFEKRYPVCIWRWELWEAALHECR